MAATKTIDGEIFRHYKNYQSKRQATAIASNIRANAPRNGKVRVIKTSDGYSIYTRGC